MPLLKNTDQPYFSDPHSPAVVNCAGDFCYPISQDDNIYQQWYQTPCGNNEIADPLFSNATYGAELIANGTFTGSLASWTTTAWVYDTNKAKGPITTPVNDLTQNIGTLTAATFYLLQFDISGLSAGDEVRVYLGNTGSWYTYAQNGSYSNIIRSGSDNLDIVFVAGGTNLANALLDNVSLKLASWGDWDTNGDWTPNVSDGIVCANGSGIGILEETVANYIISGGYYQMTITLTGYFAGSLVCKVANVTDFLATVITANGIYTLYFLPTATGVVSFEQSTDFVGCLSSPDLRELKNDYFIELVRSTGERWDISNYLNYYEDKVTMNEAIFLETELYYGCYTMELTDSCLVEGIDLMTNGNFTLGASGWTPINGSWQYNIAGGECDFIFNPLENGNIITNGDFSAGAAGWTVGAGWAIVTSATHTPGNVAALSRSITINVPVLPAILQHWIQITVSGRTAGFFSVTLSDSTSEFFADNGTFCFRFITPPTIGGAVTISINPSTLFDGVIDNIEVYEATRQWSQSPTLYNTINPLIVAGNYVLSFEITAITGTGYIGAAGSVLGQTQSLSPQTTVAVHNINITGYTPGFQLPQMMGWFGEPDSVTGGTRSYVGTSTIDNITLVRVEPFDATYISECLNYQEEHEGTYLLTGYCDQDSFGFDFTNTGFLLQMRTKIRGLNPTFNKNKNIARFGTGDAAVTYADETKTWRLVTDFMPESAHDCLSTIIDCDHFYIGNIGGNGIEYVADAEDYTPDWRAEGDYDLAPVTINIRKKTAGMNFNRHT